MGETLGVDAGGARPPSPDGEPSPSQTAVPRFLQPELTADALPGRTGLFQECVREGLARRGLARPAAPQRTHAVVSPGANHGHVDPFDESGQGRGGVPHRLASPGLRGLTESEEQRMKTKADVILRL